MEVDDEKNEEEQANEVTQDRREEEDQEKDTTDNDNDVTWDFPDSPVDEKKTETLENAVPPKSYSVPARFPEENTADRVSPSNIVTEVTEFGNEPRTRVITVEKVPSCPEMAEIPTATAEFTNSEDEPGDDESDEESEKKVGRFTVTARDETENDEKGKFYVILLLFSCQHFK